MHAVVWRAETWEVHYRCVALSVLGKTYGQAACAVQYTLKCYVFTQLSNCVTKGTFLMIKKNKHPVRAV